MGKMCPWNTQKKTGIVSNLFHVIVNRNTDTFCVSKKLNDRLKINYTHNIVYLLSEILAISLVGFFWQFFVHSLPEISEKKTVHLKLHFTISYRGSIISYDTYIFFSRFLNLLGLTSWQNDPLGANINLGFNKDNDNGTI